MKTLPTLADDMLYGQALRYPFDPPRLSMLTAKRFVLDSSASAFLGTIIGKVGRLVLREHEFARAPYDQTWIEMDFRSYWRALTGGYEPTAMSDGVVGYLIDKGKVHCAARSHITSSWLPYIVRLHTPVSFEEELALAQSANMSRMTLRHALLGTSEHIGHEWWENEGKDIARSHKFEFLEHLALFNDEGRHKMLLESAGLLKQILALLLLLTRPGRHVLQFSEEPNKRAIFKGKTIRLVEHHKIKLHLDQSVAMRRFVTGIHTGLHRKEHDVKGHWAQTRRFQNYCQHNWEPVDRDHYFCLLCQAKKWWRKDHKRGSDTLGTISKEYEVTE